jgi:hypothetical protein
MYCITKTAYYIGISCEVLSYVHCISIHYTMQCFWHPQSYFLGLIAQHTKPYLKEPVLNCHTLIVPFTECDGGKVKQ